ncbi:MAG: GTP-binding protein EngB [Methanothrix sp.]|uniref:GTP-binding protein EngB n=1 Tax=Methanothrix sp. TaxID=90426 RepID=UPI0025E45F6F|nr:GTP-binding protein EngB [Methanothrix sp.]MCQ8903313.1 GTP-binding protein EngB [Methanothrix sp.]
MCEIVLVGRSNVGKSTLFRALTGEKVPIGRRPGVTVRPYSVRIGSLTYVDMPGYGFMKYRSWEEQERVKDLIVRYLEDHADRIITAVQVTDAASFLEIAERWERRGEVPVEIEMWDFLCDLKLNPILAANKIDRISNKDQVMDWIAERLGMEPPWRRWDDRIAPISAKRGEIEPLRNLLKSRIELSRGKC